MGCDVVPLRDPAKPREPLFVTVCTRGSGVRRRRCWHCGKLDNLLCDGPVAVNKTCDRPICRGCATSGGPNIDYCRDCARDWPGASSLTK